VIESRIRPDATVECRPLGRLDWIGGTHLLAAVESWLRAGTELVIDLSQIDWIDADGISALKVSSGLVDSLGGSVVLGNAAPEVECILVEHGLRQLLTMEPTPCAHELEPLRGGPNWTSERIDWSDDHAVGRKGWYY